MTVTFLEIKELWENIYSVSGLGHMFDFSVMLNLLKPDWWDDNVFVKRQVDCECLNTYVLITLLHKMFKTNHMTLKN